MAEKSEKRRIYLYINGKEVHDNLRSLTAASRKLYNELAGLTPGTDKFVKKSKELEQVRGRIQEIKNEAAGFGGTLGSLKKALSSNIGSMIGWGAAITSVVSIFRGAYRVVSDFDEGVADLAKTSGLAKEEARALAKDVISINTRTPVTELLNLASAAGRLGLQGQDIVDFTKQADMAFVALGDSLEGDAEQIGLTLGKIASNFDIEKKYGVGESLNKIGSALNELGANSKATEGPIVDFTTRLAGVSKQAGISMPDVAALGALFDENGQSIEVAATTFNQLLPAIGKDVERFAKIAGVNVKDFQELVEKDAFEALKLVAKGAKSNQQGLEGLSDTLQNYGVDSSRAASIVSLLSENTDRLTELQQISNTAFEEGTSLAKEFATKNETLAARTEKFTKNYDEMIISLEDGNGVFSQLISQVVDYGSSMLKTISIMNNAKTTFEGLLSVGEAHLVQQGIMTEEQAKFQMNLGKNQTLIYGFNELLNEGKITQEEYAKAINKIGSGWTSASKAIVDAKKEVSEQSQGMTAAEIEEERKKAEKAKKQAEKEAKEAIEAFKKRNEEIEKLKDEVRIKQLSDDEQEIERIRVKYDRLIEEAKGHIEQQKELEALRDEEILIKEQEQDEKRQEKEAKLLEEKLQFQQDLDIMQFEGIDRELAESERKYNKLIEQAKEFGLDSKMIEDLYSREKYEIIKKYAKKEADEVSEAEKMKREAQLRTVELTSSLMSNLIELTNSNAEETRGIRATLALIDTYASANRAYYSQLELPTPDAPARAALAAAAAITAGLINVKKIYSAGKSAGISDQRFTDINKKIFGKSHGKAKGGYTGDGMGNPDETGFKVAGYVHEGEWVAPKWMVDSPQYMDTIKMLETARSAKSGFAAGGEVVSVTTPTPNFTDQSSSGNDLAGAINTLNSILSGGIKAVAIIDQDGVLKLMENMDELKQAQA